MPRRYDREDAKRRILSVCVKLFIERGYEKTTTAEILEKADVTNGTFYNIFSTKNGVLIELTNFVFGHQFEMARNVVGKDADLVVESTAHSSSLSSLSALYLNRFIQWS